MAKIKESVFDAGPFIHLQEIQQLELLKLFEKILTTQEILDECKKIGASLRKLENLEKKELSPKSKDFAEYLTNRFELHLGESTGIALCKQEYIKLLFTDDLDARQVAHMLGFGSHGTVAIILRAFREKLITTKEAKESIGKLYTHSTLFFSNDLKDWTIREIEKFTRMIKKGA